MKQKTTCCMVQWNPKGTDHQGRTIGNFTVDMLNSMTPNELSYIAALVLKRAIMLGATAENIQQWHDAIDIKSAGKRPMPMVIAGGKG